MQELLSLPDYGRHFYPNMGFGITMGGMSTSVNVFNYYNSTFFGGEVKDLDAVAEVSFHDFRGRHRFQHRERLEPYGSLHLDLKTKLLESGRPDTYGTFLCRLIPLELPPALNGKPISTEFVMEVTSASGDKSFVHNTWSPVYGPAREKIRSEQIFWDSYSTSKYLVLMSNYHGPRLPFLSHGRTQVKIVNHNGDSISTRSERVPARGTRLASFAKLFPNLGEFLDGQAGEIVLDGYNIVRKPIVLSVAPSDDNNISINHF